MAVTDEAILKIKDMLTGGDLRPGDRLPPEKQLSEQLGLSRSSLREAVKALELIRVLDVRQGDGTYVTSLEPHLLLGATAFTVDLFDDDGLLEVLQVRRLLEPAAAATACARARPDDVARLRDLAAPVGPGAQLEDLVERDQEFHRCLAGMAGNAYLAGLLDSLAGRALRTRLWRGLTPDGVTRTLDEHRAIAEAVAGGDADLVRSWVTVHLGGAETLLRRAAADRAGGQNA